MPRRKWLSHLAAVGLVVASLFAAGPALTQQTERQDERAGARAEAQKANSDEPATTHFAEGFKVDTHTYRAICDQPKNKDHADLCQQWRTAEAAETQVNLSAANLALIIVTVIFTALAAISAGKAANAAHASAERATDTLRIMEETAERQLRAYVHVKALKIKNAKSEEWSPTVQVQFQNFGATPAYAVRQIIAIGWFPPEPVDESRFTLRDDRWNAFGDLGPTQFMTASLVPDWVPWLSQRPAVWGKIEYMDVFKRPRSTDFRSVLFVDADGMLDSDSLSPCRTGNKAT
jgi:hypothetical protein